MESWHTSKALSESLKPLFNNLTDVFSLQGECITRDSISELIKVRDNQNNYYVKRYKASGRNLRKVIGKPRVQSEWENLQYFVKIGIPTAEVIAYGLETKWGRFKRGALVTAEIPFTKNLVDFAESNPNISFKEISYKIGAYTALMHRHAFIHNDLKWRNILINQDMQIYFIDCPSGKCWFGPLLNYRIIKDLKSLDVYAEKYTTRTNRLRFLLAYTGEKKLSEESKSLLKRVLSRRYRRKDKQTNLS